MEKDNLKQKLIIAGIDEIRMHGVTDFSLRRVAQSCGASCAAPYRHFKNKNEFILEIIKYINEKWSLLFNQISNSNNVEAYEAIEQLLIMYIRFRIANPDFYAILMLQHDELENIQKKEILKSSSEILEIVEKYLIKKELTKDEINVKLYQLQALIQGTIIMIYSDDFDPIKDMDKICNSIREILN